MSSFKEQIDAAKVAYLAANTVEAEARASVVQIFADWEAGKISNRSVRFRLEAAVRQSYRASAALAAAHASGQSGIPGWVPSGQIFNTEYLSELLIDTRRNLRNYRASERTEKDRRRAVLRVQHSAGVGAQRGFTDALIASYAELEDFGYMLRKIWLANFANGNVPCDYCQKLHGMEVGLHDNFPYPKHSKSTKVYLNLKGPPRHPRCQCKIVVLVVSLENAFEEPNIDDPQESPDSMDTDGVQKLPWKVFMAIIKALKKVITFVKGG